MGEAQRLEALYRYQVLDTAPEQGYDDITELAAQMCETPIAVVSLVDDARQWFKSVIGLDVRQTERCVAFCDHAIRQPSVLVVPDATRDVRFHQNPLVTGAPHIRFYAGAPLITPDGQAIGTLCVINSKPQNLSNRQIQALERLARQVVHLLEARIKSREEHRANEALRAATAAKSQFLANMSHEIRTPINGVIGMTDLVLDTKLTDEQRDYVETIRASADTLLAIINDVLDLSKIEAGKLDIENIHFDFEKVVGDIYRTLELQAKQKDLKLVREIAGGITPKFIGDPGRIRQVLMNLVGNAIKFSHKGEIRTRVELARETDGRSRVRVEVKDCGIGIPKDVACKLFSPFTQADSSTSRRYGGTGLGLSISKRLVDLMGGDIGVESVPGEGATFWFTLQLENSTQKADENAAVAASLRRSHQDRSFRILLAEDNVVNQKIAMKMLEKLGYRVDCVANGNEALTALSSSVYDLVLMDCQMPELDGYDATKAIRGMKKASYRAIPIVAMTANAMKGDREKCLEAGMNDYLSKPVRLGDLDAVIEKYLVKLKTA